MRRASVERWFALNTSRFRLVKFFIDSGIKRKSLNTNVSSSRLVSCHSISRDAKSS